MGHDTIEESSSKVLTEAGSSTAVKTKKDAQAFGELYKEFKASGLSVLDSFFNALYIRHTDKLCAKHMKKKNVTSGVFAHPAGWYKGVKDSEKAASASKSIKLLEAVAKILSPFSKSIKKIKHHSGFFSDNSVLALKNLSRFIKKGAPVCAALACAALLFTSVYSSSEKTTVVEFSVNGKPVGMVASAKTVDQAIESLNSEISSAIGKAFSFPYEVSYSFKDTDAHDCMNAHEVYEKLCEYTSEFTVEGYGLYIDSKLIAVMDSRDDIVNVLDTVKNERMKLTGEDGSIANAIDIKYREYSPDMLVTESELLSMFSIEDTVEEEAETTTVYRALLSQPAEVSTISFEGATPELREALESALEETDGDAIVLDFEVSCKETVQEVIPYETKYVNDNNYYIGQEVITVTGKTGYAESVYEVKSINGVETSRVLLEQSITREPRTCVVNVGTRPLPEKLNSYKSLKKYMINPVPTAMVTSRYGGRILRGKSDFHHGLDLAAPTGTPIYAAATGDVIYAGYSSSWGYNVKIRHPDGLITLYAHCSELLVETGDTVAQGAEIALVGSTGNSTGPHCHFEVYIEGERVDPELFLYSLD
ncbi:MAG: hypothetical protein E7613_02435 [Ruminococcaceae bacterium]|nr:hypothetical protein [Oscillospiraceae bacterium]